MKLNSRPLQSTTNSSDPRRQLEAKDIAEHTSDECKESGRIMGGSHVLLRGGGRDDGNISPVLGLWGLEGPNQRHRAVGSNSTIFWV